MKRNDRQHNHKYYILIKDVLEQGITELHLGTLWIFESKLSPSLVLVCKYEGSDAGILKQVELLYLQEINYETTKLLLAVPNPLSNRIRIIKDPVWLQEGIDIQVGTEVAICNFPGLSNGSLGEVKFKGRLPGKNGTSFGVELQPGNAGKGSTNGMYRYKQLFNCDEDCGIFVSLLNIRVANKDHSYSSSLQDKRPAAESLPHNNGATGEDHDLSSQPDDSKLYVNERIVWMSDYGPEFGTVKWIGILPYSHDNKTVVGVEFDNPVGTGTGKYKGVQLFRARRNYASLIPVLGLLRADVYMSMMAVNEPKTGPTSVSYTDFQIGLDDTEHRILGDGKVSIEKSSLEKLVDQYDKIDVGTISYAARGLKANAPSDFSVTVNKEKDPWLSDKIDSENVNMKIQTNLHGNPEIQTDSGYLKTGDNILVKHNEQEWITDKSDTEIFKMKTQTNVNSNIQSDSGFQKTAQNDIIDLSLEIIEGFKYGDRVSVAVDKIRTGTIKWMGKILQSKNPNTVIAGIEMDVHAPYCTDGTFQKIKLFDCPPKSALFIQLRKCMKIVP